jgi:hypothetical protein
VGDVARGLIPRLEGIVGRRMISLSQRSESLGGEAEGKEDVAKLKKMCEEAEEEAKKVNKAQGGWLDEPDLSKRRL